MCCTKYARIDEGEKMNMPEFLQAQRLAEEAHSVGSLVMTRVSAELKMARSLVRLAEIQATLHEQRYVN